jgi:hypothetical protein
MSSPLRRAVQTASFAFGPTIRRPEVQFLLVPMAQEVSGKNCNIGFDRAELKHQLPGLLGGQYIGFDTAKIDLSLLEYDWNSKVGYNALGSPSFEMQSRALLLTDPG